ncbi:MAG: hypothetical protein AB7S78_00895 [Candidatus Omnitrophota bacterium]
MNCFSKIPLFLFHFLWVARMAFANFFTNISGFFNFSLQPLALLFGLLILTAGCASGPYMRSDVFLDHQMVKSIYIMPVVTEVTIDSGLKITASDLRERLMDTKIRISVLLKDELSKRGYGVKAYEKEFSALDSNVAEDQLVKSAVQEFLHPSGSINQTNDAGAAIVQSLIESIFASGNMTVTDKHGKKIELLQPAVQSSGPKEPDPLITKTLEARSLIPPDVDTVMYIYIKSYIAKRGLFYSITENSFADVEIKMISLPKGEIIFSDKEGEVKTDILDWKSFKDNIANILARIPVKL